jgi:hypothetical protein
MAAKIAEMREQVKNPLKDKVLPEVTVAQAYGGMRGIVEQW